MTSGLVRSDRAEIVHSIISPYLTARKDRDILGDYERIAPGEDGRVRTVLSPVVTETGRLASGESFVDPASTNLQNLPKKESFKDQLYRVRDCFIADPGYVLLARDFDKAEAVVMAFESENWDFYTKLVEGEDVHKWVAAAAYHQGNQKSVLKAERQRCKNVLYASFYMAGVPKITRTINDDATSKADKLTEAEVAKIYDVIMDLLHLDIWWDSVKTDLLDPNTYGGVRWLENCLGFRRMFYNPDEYDMWKEAVNFFPQSTVASRIDQVLIESYEELEKPGEFELLLQVHDELMWQVRRDKLHYYNAILDDMMNATFRAKGKDVMIPSSAEVGTRWDGFRGAKDEPLDPSNELGRMTSISKWKEAA